MNEAQTMLRSELFRATEVLDNVWKHADMTDKLREAVEEAVRAAEAALNATRPPRWDDAYFAAAHPEETEADDE